MKAFTAAWLAVTLSLGLVACSDDAEPPGESSVEVDTPELREMKAEAQLEDCAPGPGGGDLPDLTLACLGGGADVALDSLRGPLVINLWASYCEPCREEMPALQAFHAEYGDRVPVLGINLTDTYPEAAIALAQDTGARYPQLADPGGDLYDQRQLELRPGLPQFILLDAGGAVAHQSAGGVETGAEVVDMVETHLGVDL